MNLLKKTSEQVKTKLLSSALMLKSGVYYLESNPLLYLEQWVRFKKLQLPKQYVSEEELLKEVKALIQKDSQYFSEGVFPISLLQAKNPIKHTKNLLKIYVDSLDVYYSKKFNKNKVFKDKSKSKNPELPDYYKRNFHNQTDGYLSEDSAKLYEHQVEILFRGTADVMRRLILPPLIRSLDCDRNYKIIEVGAGTGISTRPLSLVFKNSQINAYDLSEDYLKYAEKNHGFKNTSYKFGNGEHLNTEESCSTDLWCSTFMFHELPQENRIKVLTEAYRVLKPGGVIAIVDSIQHHDRPDFEEILTAFPQNYHEPYYKNYTLNPIEKDLKKAGFINIEHEIGFLSKACWGIKK